MNNDQGSPIHYNPTDNKIGGVPSIDAEDFAPDCPPNYMFCHRSGKCKPFRMIGDGSNESPRPDPSSNPCMGEFYAAPSQPTLYDSDGKKMGEAPIILVYPQGTCGKREGYAADDCPLGYYKELGPYGRCVATGGGSINPLEPYAAEPSKGFFAKYWYWLLIVALVMVLVLILVYRKHRKTASLV
jgi:hypothetical protein